MITRDNLKTSLGELDLGLVLEAVCVAGVHAVQLWRLEERVHAAQPVAVVLAREPSCESEF